MSANPPRKNINGNCAETSSNLFLSVYNEESFRLFENKISEVVPKSTSLVITLGGHAILPDDVKKTMIKYPYFEKCARYYGSRGDTPLSSSQLVFLHLCIINPEVFKKTMVKLDAVKISPQLTIVEENISKACFHFRIPSFMSALRKTESLIMFLSERAYFTASALCYGNLYLDVTRFNFVSNEAAYKQDPTTRGIKHMANTAFCEGDFPIYANVKCVRKGTQPSTTAFGFVKDKTEDMWTAIMQKKKESSLTTSHTSTRNSQDTTCAFIRTCRKNTSEQSFAITWIRDMTSHVSTLNFQ